MELMEQIFDIIMENKALTGLGAYLLAEAGVFKSKLKGKNILWDYILRPIWENMINEYQEYKSKKEKSVK